MTGTADPRRPPPPVWSVFLLPALLYLATTLPHLDQGDWARTDNGRYASVGVQAWRTGEFWSLQAEPGIPYFNKPPLAIWIHGGVLHAFGLGPIQSRLPAVLAGLGCVVVWTATARRLAGPTGEHALWSGYILALSHGFFHRCRSISLDTWQLLFMLLAVHAVVLGVQATEKERRRGRGAGRPWAMALAGVPLGMALLCKPFVALLLPPILAIWLAWIGRARLLPWLVATTLVAITVAAPWHVSMALTHGRDFIDQYLGRQVALRTLGGLPMGEGGHEPWWYYLERLATFGPWIPLALCGAVWIARGRRLSDDGAAERLALVWFVCWFALLTAFPDRRDRYSIVLYPGLAMLAGCWFADQRTRLADAASWCLQRVLPIAAVAAAIAVAFLPVRLHSEEHPAWPRLFAWLEAQPKPPGARVPEFWQGAFALERAGRVYLRYGVWPRATRDHLGRPVVDPAHEPPEGALIIYGYRDGLRPGPNEVQVFPPDAPAGWNNESPFAVTRLGPGGWRPVASIDPGE